MGIYRTQMTRMTQIYADFFIINSYYLRLSACFASSTSGKYRQNILFGHDRSPRRTAPESSSAILLPISNKQSLDINNYRYICLVPRK